MPRREPEKTNSLLQDDLFSNMDSHKARQLIGIGLAEMVGVCLFMMTGCGSLVHNMTGANSSHIEVVLSFAFGISLSVILFGHISGPMLNPVLSLTWLLLGHMSIYKFVFYTVCQMAGAYLGVAVIAAVSPDQMIADGDAGFCTTHPSSDIPLGAAFTIEFVACVFLAITLAHVLDKRSEGQEPLIFIKFAVFVVALVVPLAKYEGGSLNPARSFGPALLSGDWEHQWFYWVAPMLGGATGTLMYQLFWKAEITQPPPTFRLVSMEMKPNEP